MKLLFDENLSPKLSRELAGEYPQSLHVFEAGLAGATDRQIWDYAGANRFTIVSKDSDFREWSRVEGWPPKVLWLDVGNSGTTLIVLLLREQRARIEEFCDHQEESFFTLRLPMSA